MPFGRGCEPNNKCVPVCTSWQGQLWISRKYPYTKHRKPNVIDSELHQSCTRGKRARAPETHNVGAMQYARSNMCIAANGRTVYASRWNHSRPKPILLPQGLSTKSSASGRVHEVVLVLKTPNVKSQQETNDNTPATSGRHRFTTHCGGTTFTAIVATEHAHSDHATVISMLLKT